MPMNHSRKAAQIDAKEIGIHLSPAVTSAFGELEAAVRSSEHFDKDVLRTVQDFAAGQDKERSTAYSSRFPQLRRKR